MIVREGGHIATVRLELTTSLTREVNARSGEG